jgi:hypothetical protein
MGGGLLALAGCGGGCSSTPVQPPPHTISTFHQPNIVNYKQLLLNAIEARLTDTTLTVADKNTLKSAKSAIKNVVIDAAMEFPPIDTGDAVAAASAYPAWNLIIVWRTYWETATPKQQLDIFLHEIGHLLNPGFTDGTSDPNLLTNTATKSGQAIKGLLPTSYKEQLESFYPVQNPTPVAPINPTQP